MERGLSTDHVGKARLSTFSQALVTGALLCASEACETPSWKTGPSGWRLLPRGRPHGTPQLGGLCTGSLLERWGSRASHPFRLQRFSSVQGDSSGNKAHHVTMCLTKTETGGTGPAAGVKP